MNGSEEMPNKNNNRMGRIDEEYRKELSQIIGFELKNSNITGMISVTKVKDNPILIRSIDSNGYAVNLLSESSTKRRQDFQDFYKVNGAIYINKINQNLNNKTSLNDNKLVYIMDEKYDVDIDEMLDLQIAEIMMSNMDKH